MDIRLTMPSIVFRAKGILFSIPSTNAQSIIQMPRITEIPNTADSVRGIIKHRNEIYNLIDFRKKLSFKTLQEELGEFKSMIDQREHDHIKWLQELQDSVHDDRPFKLTTDPHKCAFGKWYDKFKSDNFFINEVLKKFDEPHKTIHSIAQKIEKFKESNKFEEAHSLIRITREQELAQMKILFSKIKETIQLHSKERVILFNNNNYKFAIAVDQIESVEEIKKIETKAANDQLLDFGNKNFILGLGEDKNQNLVILVSEELLN
jgi:purine-binding chemotaxis protein CheW